MKLVKQHVGNIGVDSGQMMLIDPCYVEHDNLDSRNAAIIGAGAICSTGWGDGCYPVHVMIDQETNRVASMHIQFME